MDTLNSTHPLKDIDILEGLASFPGGATLSRICESTELNKSTALRLLKALTDRGYVIRDEATKMYRLSYKVLALSSAVLDTIEIKKIARNYLKEISGITNETIHLLCKEGTEAIYIDKIDTPNTIGLKSQIGRHIHISAATQIGGVLEPAGAMPTIIEDGAFVGGNCGIYEGTIVREKAVIASGVIITASTPVFDATVGEFLERNADGRVVVPEGAVVVSGSKPLRKGPAAGSGVSLYCPVIVKYRDDKTSGSVILEDLLR